MDTPLGDHKKRFGAWNEAIRRDILEDGIVPPTGTRSGVIYFVQPPQRDGGELLVRVVDLDDAVRYTLRFPLPAR